LLQRDRFLWKDVLVAKYGNRILFKMDLENEIFPTNSSRWWKDICTIDSVVDSKRWFSEGEVRKVRNGGNTLFWLDR
jgi:hypothetical protein